MTWFSDAGVRPNRFSTCNSLLHIERLAASGIGAALLPIAILSDEILSGALSDSIPLPQLNRTGCSWLCALIRISPACAVVQDIAREVVAASPLAPLRP